MSQSFETMSYGSNSNSSYESANSSLSNTVPTLFGLPSDQTKSQTFRESPNRRISNVITKIQLQPSQITPPQTQTPDLREQTSIQLCNTAKIAEQQNVIEILTVSDSSDSDDSPYRENDRMSLKEKQTSETKKIQDNLINGRLGPKLRTRPMRQCALRYGSGSGKGGLKRMAQLRKKESDDEKKHVHLSIKEMIRLQDDYSAKAAMALQPFTKFVKSLKNQPWPRSERLVGLEKLKEAGEIYLSDFHDDCQMYVDYARSVSLMLNQLDIDANSKRKRINTNWSPQEYLSS